jgi:hypothetical protein
MSGVVDIILLTMVKRIDRRWKGRKLYEFFLINYENKKKN